MSVRSLCFRATSRSIYKSLKDRSRLNGHRTFTWIRNVKAWCYPEHSRSREPWTTNPPHSPTGGSTCGLGMIISTICKNRNPDPSTRHIRCLYNRTRQKRVCAHGRLPLVGGSLPVGGDHFVELVVGADFLVGLDGEKVSFRRFSNGGKVNPDIVGGDKNRAGGRAGNQQLVARLYGLGLYQEFGHADISKMLDRFSHVHLPLGGTRPVTVRPLAQSLAQVVAVPETAVKHGREAIIPIGDFLFRVRSLAIRLHRLLVARGHHPHVFRAAGASFDLEHPHPGIHHLVHEMDGL